MVFKYLASRIAEGVADVLDKSIEKYGSSNWFKSNFGVARSSDHLAMLAASTIGNTSLCIQSFGVGGSFAGCGFSVMRGLKSKSKVGACLSYTAATLHGGSCACFAFNSLAGKLVTAINLLRCCCCS